MEVRDHGADVPRRVRAAGGPVGRPQVVDEPEDPRLPDRRARLVDAVNVTAARDLDLLV